MAAKPKWVPPTRDEQRVYDRRVLEEAVEKDQQRQQSDDPPPEPE